jgi:hypothetical protein
MYVILAIPFSFYMIQVSIHLLAALRELLQIRDAPIT